MSNKNKIIIASGTKVYLSEVGYYDYFYMDINKHFIVEKEIIGKPISWISPKKWTPILIPPEELKAFPTRPCNVVWLEDNEYV